MWTRTLKYHNRMARLRRRLTNLCDRCLALIKWPVALAALLLLPGALFATIELFGSIAASPVPALPFFAGALCYGVVWWWISTDVLPGHLFCTLEHELTHCVFALLTFHPVMGLVATSYQGGKMVYSGKGNWLVTLSPYFFPTFSVFLAGLINLFAAPVRPWLTGLLGVSFSYHVLSTWRETHPGQTDLKKVGYTFAILVLPFANIACLAAIVAYAWGGASATTSYLRAIGTCTRGWLAICGVVG